MGDFTTAQNFSAGDLVTDATLNNIAASSALDVACIVGKVEKTTSAIASDRFLVYESSSNQLKKLAPDKLLPTNSTLSQNLTFSGATTLSGATTISGQLTATNSPIKAVSGVLFGSDTAAVNTLDDYEEGTWTPAIAGSSGSSGWTYATQKGRYTKIGNLVMIVGEILVPPEGGGTATGSWVITGLPFVNNASDCASFYFGRAIVAQPLRSIAGKMFQNGQIIYLTGSDSQNADTWPLVNLSTSTNYFAGCQIHFAGHYFVN